MVQLRRYGNEFPILLVEKNLDNPSRPYVSQCHGLKISRSELHKVWQLADSEALQLRNVRSGHQLIFWRCSESFPPNCNKDRGQQTDPMTRPTELKEFERPFLIRAEIWLNSFQVFLAIYGRLIPLFKLTNQADRLSCPPVRLTSAEFIWRGIFKHTSPDVYFFTLAQCWDPWHKKCSTFRWG